MCAEGDGEPERARAFVHYCGSQKSDLQDCEVLVRTNKRSIDATSGVQTDQSDLDIGDQRTRTKCASEETGDESSPR